MVAYAPRMPRAHLLILAALLVPRAAKSADWTAVRAGQSRTGSVDSPTHPPYTLLWSRTGAMVSASDPLVAFGRVFIADGESRIMVLDATTGAHVWQVRAAAGPGEVRVFEAAGGSIRWTRTLGAKVLRAPQVNHTEGYAVSTDGTVTALRQGSGEVLWTAKVDAPVTTAAADGRAVVLGAGNAARALDPDNGETIFEVNLPGPLAFVPALTPAAAYLPLGSSVVSVDRKGKRRWKAELPRPISAPLVISATGMVVATVDGTIRLFEDAKGREVWEAIVAGSPTTLVAAGHVVYVGTKQGNLAGLRLTDGRQIWSAALGKGAITGLASANGGLVVTAGDWTGALRPAPSAPDEVRAEVDGRRVRLAWTEGIANGAPITGYRVWRRRGNQLSLAGTTGTATRGFEEAPLGGDTAYVVTSVARDGAESAPSDPALHAALDPIVTRLTVLPLPYDSRHGELKVGFELRLAARVTWRILDLEGVDVTDDRTEILAPGSNVIRWDGRDKSRRHTAPGHYKIRLMADASGLADAATGGVSVAWGFDATGGGTGPGGTTAGGPGQMAGAPGGSAGGPVASGPAGGTAGTPHDSGVHAGENPQGFVIDHSPGNKGQGGGNSKGGGN